MWINEHFNTKKPILAMCHMRALPSDPHFDKVGGMDYVIECARKDVTALQDGGVDGIIFANEFSLPYEAKTQPVVLCAMARVIEACKDILRVPFGTNVIGSAWLSCDLAVATGATFIRGPITGTFVSMAGTTELDAGAFTRHKIAIGGEDLKVISYVVPEGADYVGNRPLADLARLAEFRAEMDVISVAGLVAGAPVDTQEVGIIKSAVKHTPVFVNTGCRKETIVDQLKVADGAVVATTFKYDGIFENLVDYNRVKEFMDIVKEYRATL